MSLILVENEMLEQLDRLTAAWLGNRLVGLFQNDWTPRHDSGIAEVVPATFSGYVGLQAITGWLPAVIEQEAAVASAAALTWVRGAGPTNNWIFGYYVVDGAGVLRWAERNPTGPVAIVNVGNLFQVTPQFTVGSRY